MKKYALGIDYGTESGRVLLVNVSNGEEVASHVTPYPHGVIDEILPGSGKSLGNQWALQHPDDYLEVLRRSIPEVISVSNVNPADIVGIGVDFTACTMMPVDAKGVPLCFHPDLRENPHSWVKLWKHHAAQVEANYINHIASVSNQSFLKRYGGKTSSEWMLAKILQVFREAPELYDQTDLFIEAADWIVFMMTGTLTRNSCAAGYKALWHKEHGYPDRSFFKKLDPKLENLTETKLRGRVIPLGAKSGELTDEMAKLTDLVPGIAVAVGNIDAHVGVVGSGVVTPGKMVISMGTSNCHMLLSEEEKHPEGICGVVEDGIIPGLYGYEAGQSAVGDIFAWFIENGIPAYMKEEAEDKGISVFDYLEQKASALRPGETGLLALDWWNGNRSILVDTDLSGVIVGYSLHTKPEEIYRSLLEATAFGTRKIMDSFQDSGIIIDEIYACGGLPQRNRLLMQIYADVTRREIKIAASTQTPALGASIFGAVAAGSIRGGYNSVEEAAKNMTHLRDEIIRPIQGNCVVYDQLYLEYCKLHDYFGRGINDVMKRLKSICEASI